MGKLRYAFPVLILIFVLVLTTCGGDKTTTPTTTTEQTTMTTIFGRDELVITATAFEDGGVIPAAYSCNGQDKSPELNWMNVLEGTQSFALIMDDPDAPGGTFTHWVIFNIPAGATGLEENIAKIGELPDGTLQGRNSFGAIGYGGPCPPSGSSHRYYFTLYALDTDLALASGATKAQVLAAMEGHVLAEAEMTGNYQR